MIRKPGLHRLKFRKLRAALGREGQQPFDGDDVEAAAGQPFGARGLVLKLSYLAHGLTFRRDNLKQIASFQFCRRRA